MSWLCIVDCVDKCGSDEGLSCSSMTDLLCCSPSPVRLAIQSLPDWSQAFAQTLKLRPQLLLQLANTTTVSNDDDNNNNKNNSNNAIDCSPPQKIEAQRQLLMKDVDLLCQRYTCPVQVLCTRHVQLQRRSLSIFSRLTIFFQKYNIFEEFENRIKILNHLL